MRKIFYNPDGASTSEGVFDAEIAWPKTGQRLLNHSIASTPKEVSAHLDWLQTFNKNDLAMPDAYKHGADYLVEALRLGSDGSHPDRFVFPILYLYRHATELRLKEIIRLGLRLGLEIPSDALEKTLRNHALSPLWDRSRGILEKYWPDGNSDDLLAVESMIQELHKTDHDGQHFRYATSNKGELLEHKLPEQLDLIQLRTAFNGVWNLFDGSYSGLIDALANQP